MRTKTRSNPPWQSSQSDLAAALAGFRTDLEEVGYSTVTVARYGAAIRRFGRWAGDREPFLDWSDSTLESFLGKNASPARTLPLRRFLQYLRWQGVPVAVMAPPQPPVPAILRTFGEWMARNRGLALRTMERYLYLLRELIDQLGDDPSRYDTRKLRSFLLAYDGRHGRIAAQHASIAMRSFLRYLAAEGRCAPGLDNAIPTVARWRLAALPHALRPEEIERLLGVCNRTTPVGRRDRAVLLLLARFGLRAADVVDLRLGDLDWNEGTIRLRGKERREGCLPMTQEIGDALLAYLEEGRPMALDDHVFLNARAPVRAWRGSTAVCSIVAKYLRRAGIDSPSRGAHLLRHSAATAMLRQGASLDEIGAVLRHRSRETTALYAKVDRELLQSVAQPWPEVTPC